MHRYLFYICCACWWQMKFKLSSLLWLQIFALRADKNSLRFPNTSQLNTFINFCFATLCYVGNNKNVFSTTKTFFLKHNKTIFSAEQSILGGTGDPPYRIANKAIRIAVKIRTANKACFVRFWRALTSFYVLCSCRISWKLARQHTDIFGGWAKWS